MTKTIKVAIMEVEKDVNKEKETYVFFDMKNAIQEAQSKIDTYLEENNLSLLDFDKKDSFLKIEENEQILKFTSYRDFGNEIFNISVYYKALEDVIKDNAESVLYTVTALFEVDGGLDLKVESFVDLEVARVYALEQKDDFIGRIRSDGALDEESSHETDSDFHDDTVVYYYLGVSECGEDTVRIQIKKKCIKDKPNALILTQEQTKFTLGPN
ncbi:hypothetical protein bcgnr5378_06520 [Bacillus cereus]|uniref:Uncharacterized protein n=1 Tax=Bacillus cereus TaxID=1396 RepID=A0A164L9X3_BACCE|nr:hypothetical protein [Bacillus cereus]KZD55586.1 hypothetical protein B4088_5331 [Bacillus cereus]